MTVVAILGVSAPFDSSGELQLEEAPATPSCMGVAVGVVFGVSPSVGGVRE